MRLNSLLLSAALALGLAVSSPAATAQTAARPAAKAAGKSPEKAPPKASPSAGARTPAKKPPAKPAPRKPEPPPLPAAGEEQREAFKLVHLGRYECEFKQVLDVAPSPRAESYVDVTLGKQTWTMKPVLSSTGARRLEDVDGAMLVVQIAYKSMLMDVKAGRRVADECVHAEQLAARQRDEASGVVAGAAGSLLGAPTPVTLKLRILETSDIHMNLVGYDYYQDKPVEDFGLDRTATLITAARAEVRNTLLSDADSDVSGEVPSGDYVVVAVTDSGTGMGAEVLQRAFEPFFTTKEVGKGTGLGLSQAFGFAKQSEGDIAVSSRLGFGATFTIYLPEAAKPAAASDVAAIRNEPSTIGRGYRVLVVEDNDEVGRFSTELLEDLGYVVRRVANATDALAILAEDEFAVDLVFSDVIMPGINGLELAGLIRERYPGLPVVLTSGYSHVLAENAHHGFELIKKPYSVESLSRILRKAMADKAPLPR